MRIVCISDTHLIHRAARFEVPDGDVLLHAGDATFQGKLPEIRAFNEWFAALPHPHKVFVAGNHDWGFQLDGARARAELAREIVYLEDAEAEVAGLRIYGSPWQPEFCDWAFNLPRGEPLRRVWRKIPAGVDVLITHGPPLGIGDLTVDGEPVGCADLKNEVFGRVRPRLHLFGHIHEGYGRFERDGIVLVNASIVDERYRLANAPVVIDLDATALHGRRL